MALRNAFENVSTETKQDVGNTLVGYRYAGGKLAATAQVTASGDTTLITPATGKALRVFWVSAINNPDQSSTPRMIFKLGTTEIYRAYALAHWEVFTGTVNQPLVVNLNQGGDVAVTVHYQEI